MRAGTEVSAGFTNVNSGSGRDGRVDEGAGEEAGVRTGEGEGDGGVVSLMVISASVFSFTSLLTPLPENSRRNCLLPSSTSLLMTLMGTPTLVWLEVKLRLKRRSPLGVV